MVTCFNFMWLRARSGSAGVGFKMAENRLGVPTWIVYVGRCHCDERQSRWVVWPRECGSAKRNLSKAGLGAQRKLKQWRPWVHEIDGGALMFAVAVLGWVLERRGYGMAHVKPSRVVLQLPRFGGGS